MKWITRWHEKNFDCNTKIQSWKIEFKSPHSRHRHNIKKDIRNSQVFLVPFIDVREPLRDLRHFFLIQFEQLKAFRNTTSHHVPNSKRRDLFRSLQNKQSFNITTEYFWYPWAECAWMTNIVCASYYNSPYRRVSPLFAALSLDESDEFTFVYYRGGVACECANIVRCCSLDLDLGWSGYILPLCGCELLRPSAAQRPWTSEKPCRRGWYLIASASELLPRAASTKCGGRPAMLYTILPCGGRTAMGEFMRALKRGAQKTVRLL